MISNQQKTKTHSRRDFMKNSGKAIGGLALAGAMAGTLPGSSMAVNTAPKKVRIGVVGGGFGASFFWHQHPDCIVEAVSDLREDRRKKLVETYQCSKVYNSLEELVLDKNIDAVAIFTEAPNHVKHCVLTMKHGKHVICAVPAANTMEGAFELAATVEKTGLTYMMAETTYYKQSTITARKWYEEGKFGELFFCQAEYHHPGPTYPPKNSLWMDEKGNPTWRYQSPPMIYPTHTNAFITGVTGEKLVEVTCLGVGNEATLKRENRYNNPFCCETAFYTTDRGHAFRGSQYWSGAMGQVERAEWFGMKMSFLMASPHGLKPTVVTARDKSGHDEAGFAFSEPQIEHIEIPKWYETDMLPEPLRHNKGGHEGSHPFLTHEFVDALVHGRKPVIDIHESLAYTVPGIIANQSSLQGGKQMKIPQL
jgi:predicted dehydrogenase